MILQMLSNLLTSVPTLPFRSGLVTNAKTFDKIVGYEGIKRTFARTLNSKEPTTIEVVLSFRKLKSEYYEFLRGFRGSCADLAKYGLAQLYIGKS